MRLTKCKRFGIAFFGQFLAVADDELAAKLDAARVDMAQQIAAKEAKLQAELA